MEERQVLLETPSSFALFSVSEDALQMPEVSVYCLKHRYVSIPKLFF